MTADSLYDLIINFIVKGYRTVLHCTDVNIRSGSIWLLIQKEPDYPCDFYFVLFWDDPDMPKDKYKWDHEMDINKYDY